MKIPKSNFKSKIMENSKKKKKYKDDDEEKSEDEEKEKKKKKKNRKKFSKKALRKVIRTLCDEYPKDDLDTMIWEADQNLDGYVSEKEFENLYKKCVSDEKQEEAKKLYYLVQFLMYDKDEKHSITVEDTLEILCARYPNNVDQAIDSIFDVDTGEKDAKGRPKKIKKETINYIEYKEKMHGISMEKRNEISNAKKIFCDKLKDEALENARNKKYAS
jgi:Ca2+-binding EF-hand superfamily protein